MRQLAEAYVRLVLAVGRHDPAYVDAYYGPAGESGQGRRLAAGQSGMNQQVTAANWSRGTCQGRHPYWREEA